MSPLRLVARIVRRVLTRGEKLRVALLGVLVLANVGLEMLGLGLFIPTLALLTSDNAVADLRGAWGPFGSMSDLAIVLTGLGILVAVFLVKNAVGLLIAWYQRTAIARMSVRLTTDLFERYMRQPYEFHKQSNSSVLIRNVQNAYLVVTDGIGAIMSLATDGLVAVGILAVLMVVEPTGTALVAAVFVVLAWVLQRTTRSRIGRLGAERNQHNAQMLRRQQQGLSAVKEIIVSGRRDRFLVEHDRHVEGMHMANRTYGFLQQVQRAWMEIVTVVGLAILILVVVAQGRDPGDALPILGLFGVAAFRVQPSIMRMMISVQSLTYSRAVIQTFHDDFLMPVVAEGGDGAIPRLSSEIRLVGLGFQYEDRGAPVLAGVDARIARGEKIGIIGASGSGKSTLVDLLLGVVVPTEGRILVDGADVTTGVGSWQRQIGYVPQEIYLLDDTIGRNVAFGAELDAPTLAAVWDALAAAQLADFVRGLPDGIDTMVGERGVRLSGGQRQRIGIARALLGDPAVLVFDEATSALDSTTELGVLDAIRSASRDKTVVAVAHRPSTLADCDRLWRVSDGGIVDLGRPTESLLRSLADVTDEQDPS